MRGINEAKAQSFYKEKPERRRGLMNYYLVYPQRKSLILRSAALCFLGLFMILLALSSGYAQRKTFVTFKGVETPFKLKYGETVIEKGVYDFEISVTEVGSQAIFYLTPKKGKKAFCDVIGERDAAAYGTVFLMTLSENPKIPKKPSLTFKIHPEEKAMVYILETGKQSLYPYEILKFHFNYELEAPELPK